MHRHMRFGPVHALKLWVSFKSINCSGEIHEIPLLFMALFTETWRSMKGKSAPKSCLLWVSVDLFPFFFSTSATSISLYVITFVS